MGSKASSGIYVFVSFSLCMSWKRPIACLRCVTKRLETNFITLENGTSCGTLIFDIRWMRNIMDFYAHTQIAYTY